VFQNKQKQNQNKQNKKKLFNEDQTCSPLNSVHDATIPKSWGPLVDDFADINILMILGILGWHNGGGILGLAY
jgi:hypothetical protein